MSNIFEKYYSKKKKSNRKIITWRERERDYYTLGLKSYVLVQRTKYLCFKKKRKKKPTYYHLWLIRDNYESIVAKKKTYESVWISLGI